MGKQNAGAAYAGLSQHVDFSALPNPGDRFTFEKLIGEGTYGAVHSAKDKQHNNHPVAIKILEDIADNIEEIEEEFLVLRDLCLHPNIPQFHGIFFKPGRRRDDDQLWFVMELCTGGSVTDLVQTLTRLGQTLTELQIAYVIKETVDALIYLHQNHCMHRDVKGHNILFNASGHVKLVDFGVSSHLAATMGRRNTSVGTPYWMAPEVIACEQQYDYNYDVRCDVWSLGITAIELADGQPPLADIHPMRALFQIPRNPPPTLRRPADWSPVFNDFLRLCLIKDFEKRPFLRHLLEHPFLKVIPNAAEFVRIQLQDLIADVYQKVSPSSRHIEVTTKRGKLKTDRHSKLTKIYVDDLATLDKLTDDVIIDQLQQRYKSSQIYTYVGDILIAINPFAEVSLYNKEEQGRYRSLAKSDGPPHIYATADTAYHAMIQYKQNQCVVISGESGAGKTESANHLLSQLVNLGQAPNRNLEDKILAMNPIMEAFGNARTGINDNSSRFGKFLDVTFNRIGRVAGARVSVYLLEQSRVVKQDIGQQNFHIFYYLYDSLESENRLQEFHLHPQGKRNQHRYLNFHIQANNKITRKNADKMSVVNRGLSMLGFCRDELASVYRILTSIIHLGDISFMSQNDEQSNTEMVAVKNKDKLKIVCELLGVAQSELQEVLMLNSVVTRGESILRNNSHEEAVTTRDAMAKALYGRLFDWIVNQINQLLSFSRLVNGESLAVGVLDIFGFENLQNNSFEQLCINVANEQLQYYFNQHIFSWEQQEYLAEGIAIDVVEFTDNRPVLDMFLAKPLGMLSLLDEESRFPKATDASLIQKFHNNIGSSSYIRPKGNKLSFEIKHYAGKLEYNCQNMLSKNRNFLPPEVIQVFRQSSLEVVRTLFQCPLTKTGNLFTDSGALGPHSVPASPRDGVHGSPAEEGPDIGRDLLGKFCSGNRPLALASQTKAQQTVATYFRYSLMDLLQNMVNGTPHFVRCIKPNDSKKPASFDRDKVRKQLRYAGVMETVRIRQQGFSHRIAFAEFLRRYCFLAFRFDERLAATAGCCRQLLQRLKMDGWQVGRSKVFLKYYHIEYLSRLYEAKVSKIVKVQAYVRRWLARAQFRQMKVRRSRSVVTLQRCVRRWLSHKRRREDEPDVTDHGIRGRLSQVEQLMRSENMEHEEAPVSRTDFSEDVTTSKIQRLFLGHPIRKKCSPTLEGRIRAALSESNSQMEAQRRLSSVGLSPSESALVLQKCWNNRRVLNSPEQPALPLKNKLTTHTQKRQPKKSIEQIGVRSDDAANLQPRKSRDAVTSQQVRPLDQRRPADFNMPHKQVPKSENESQRASKRAASVSPPLPPLKVANQETGEIIRQGVAEMVTIREARLQAIGIGVKCQVKEEAERRESMIGRFDEATRRSGTPDIQVQFPRKVSRPPVLPDAWVAEAQIAACIAEEKESQEGAVDTSDPGARVPRIQPVSDEGPFNFRQMLRCTDHAPTESLRLRRGWKARPAVDREQDS